MMHNDEIILNQISGKLDTLIRLTALNMVRSAKTQREQISLLSETGFQPKEIAEILGTNSNVVSVTLNYLKKKKDGQESKHKDAGESADSQHDTTNNLSSDAKFGE